MNMPVMTDAQRIFLVKNLLQELKHKGVFTGRPQAPYEHNPDLIGGSAVAATRYLRGNLDPNKRQALARRVAAFHERLMKGSA